ncbi:hypothetical protein [Nonomuraea dietziae]|uniref:hypothetical protein n=1 Tax=Nonomuraea dietziae TaxID=65515 RepID=UPI0033F3C8D8
MAPEGFKPLGTVAIPAWGAPNIPSPDGGLYANNETDAGQNVSDSIAVGVETEQTKTYSVTTGISATMTSGVSTMAFSNEFSVTLSLELGFESSTSVQQLEHRVVTRNLTIPPHTAAAVWVGAQYPIADRQRQRTRPVEAVALEGPHPRGAGWPEPDPDVP